MLHAKFETYLYQKIIPYLKFKFNWESCFYLATLKHTGMKQTTFRIILLFWLARFGVQKDTMSTERHKGFLNIVKSLIDLYIYSHNTLPNTE